ncbi:MAG: 50S ribosomal protein L21 [Actinobacteria bacterium]|nr:50S ribosomal protein L21 [Actinomycetota bacterium]
MRFSRFKSLRRPEIYAVITSGGKQYKIEEDKNIVVEKIEGKEGDKITLSNVNLYSDGQKVKIGEPVLDKVTVEATIKKQFKGDKVIAFKQKAKKRYRRKVGSRPSLTLIHADKINIK